MGTRKGLCTKENIEILSLEQYLELKEQGFEFEGQSYLFWEYMRILTEICMSCGYLRRLTPTECARLQTIPEWYQWKCSNTQEYKMLDNGWTVEVIKHIFGYMIE